MVRDGGRGVFGMAVSEDSRVSSCASLPEFMQRSSILLRGEKWHLAVRFVFS
jgi:hypothetical protein